MSVANKLGFVHREVLQEERNEVSIFSEAQRILHVQNISTVLRVVLYHPVEYQRGFMGIECLPMIQSETTG